MEGASGSSPISRCQDSTKWKGYHERSISLRKVIPNNKKQAGEALHSGQPVSQLTTDSPRPWCFRDRSAVWPTDRQSGGSVSRTHPAAPPISGVQDVFGSLTSAKTATPGTSARVRPRVVCSFAHRRGLTVGPDEGFDGRCEGSTCHDCPSCELSSRFVNFQGLESVEQNVASAI